MDKAPASKTSNMESGSGTMECLTSTYCHFGKLPFSITSTGTLTVAEDTACVNSDPVAERFPVDESGSFQSIQLGVAKRIASMKNFILKNTELLAGKIFKF